MLVLGFHHYVVHFLGRPNSFLFNIELGGRLGIINNDGDYWREHRRFAMMALKDLGLGKSVMEERITSNGRDMLAAIDKLLDSGEEVIDIDFQLKCCLCNIISTLLLGHKFNRDDPVFHDYAHRLGDLVRVFGECQVLNYLPSLQYILPKIFQLNKLKEHIHVLKERFMREKIEEQRDSSRNHLDDITNIVQAYIRRMDLKQGKAEMYDYRQLEAVVYDLYTAGQEASINTIGWGLIFLLHNPEVQDRIQAEIDQNVGGIPVWEDRAKLPFTWASVLETQRLGSIVPLGVPHCNLEDVNISGYFIPKDTVVISNFVAMHRDEKYFPQPELFKPERFLDSETGKVKENLDSLVPFSIGKRSCVGENMAKMELFLLWSALLYKYKFTVPDGEKPPSLDVIYGATLAYKPFKVKMAKRQPTE